MMSWVRLERLALPKALGGCGLKNIFYFSKALATKTGWRLESSTSLWSEVVWHKYITLAPLFDWFRLPDRQGRRSLSCIWKAVMALIHVIKDGLAWTVRNGQCMRIGLDTWPGSHPNHILSRDLMEALASQNIVFLAQVGDEGRSSIRGQG